MVKVKICGLTNETDYRLALELGVDFTGFIFYPRSPRYVAPETVKAITHDTKPGIAKKVGVFVNESPEHIRAVFEQAALDIVQLHGDETPEYCSELGLPYWKAIRVRDAGSLAALKAYECDTLLLDTFSSDAYGGTGKAFDLSVARRAIEQSGRKIIVAGGVSKETISDILALTPYGIDINSSIEHSPGRKDAGRMRELVRTVRGRSAD